MYFLKIFFITALLLVGLDFGVLYATYHYDFQKVTMHYAVSLLIGNAFALLAIKMRYHYNTNFSLIKLYRVRKKC